jgi:hypothetical protein
MGVPWVKGEEGVLEDLGETRWVKQWKEEALKKDNGRTGRSGNIGLKKEDSDSCEQSFYTDDSA